MYQKYQVRERRENEAMERQSSQEVSRELERSEGLQWGRPGPGGAYWRSSAITGQGFFDKMVGGWWGQSGTSFFLISLSNQDCLQTPCFLDNILYARVGVGLETLGRDSAGLRRRRWRQ